MSFSFATIFFVQIFFHGELKQFCSFLNILYYQKIKFIFDIINILFKKNQNIQIQKIGKDVLFMNHKCIHVYI